MDYFAGLDVSLETVNVCIVNAAGDILLEKKIAAEPAAIVHLLKSFGSPFQAHRARSGTNLVLALWRAACSGVRRDLP
jgi:hypothetical protein